jgi:hypothetical protein
MVKRSKAAPPPLEATTPASGRRPRPNIKHSSLYLPEPVYEALRETAFKERCKMHDLVLQGIDHMLRKRGYPPMEGAEGWQTPAVSVGLGSHCNGQLL